MTRRSLAVTVILALALGVWGLPAVPTEALARKRLPPTVGTGAFSSRAACAALWVKGERLSRPPGTARFASWNLHWFPDGTPGERRALGGNGAPRADLGWLSCALWWLDADVIAVQEVKQSPQAEQALAAVLAELNRLSGARYASQLDGCGKRVPQHVGLIWNEARVSATELRTVSALNPTGEACQQQLRPGFAGRFRLPGGLDLAAVSVHFKSMADARSLELRRKSFGALKGVFAEAVASSNDEDFLVLGDLNTMGCDDCSPKVAAADELAWVRTSLHRAGLRLVAPDAFATYFHRGRASLLDHALGSRSMRELPQAARTHVSGACAAGSDAPRGRPSKKAREHLSDHCPIVIELLDRDLD